MQSMEVITQSSITPTSRFSVFPVLQYSITPVITCSCIIKRP
jgi:hypothetical protein